MGPNHEEPKIKVVEELDVTERGRKRNREFGEINIIYINNLEKNDNKNIMKIFFLFIFLININGYVLREEVNGRECKIDFEKKIYI